MYTGGLACDCAHLDEIEETEEDMARDFAQIYGRDFNQFFKVFKYSRLATEASLRKSVDDFVLTI